MIPFQEILEVQNEVNDYVILHTTGEDIFLAILGYLAFVINTYLGERRRFEEKTKIAFLDKAEFFRRYYPFIENTNSVEKTEFYNYWKKQEWKWKVWFKDHDEEIIVSFVFSAILIIAVPESWSAFVSLFGWQFIYVPIISLAIGYFGGKFGKIATDWLVSKRKKINEI